MSELREAAQELLDFYDGLRAKYGRIAEYKDVGKRVDRLRKALDSEDCTVPADDGGGGDCIEVPLNRMFRVGDTVLCFHQWDETFEAPGSTSGQRYSLMRLDEEEREWVPLDADDGGGGDESKGLRERVEDLIKTANVTRDAVYADPMAFKALVKAFREKTDG